ncbi:DNA mismatch repair protein MutS [Xanthomarina sp. F1114]|uniref:MutS-related protein n=1 Tax=Xanthomarina sp. F1114 TaxID=2996019 RepID=UPI00225E234D|nr:DNA mismatch repair protein MutS [Xanthomarina sp. F1114]MCX7546372.1 DNA mismatch repair protein MutS [Xanthomarina sp. F1114]
MEHPNTFYKNQLEKHQLAVKAFNKKLLGMSSLRLLVFLGVVAGIYVTFNLWQVAVAIGIIGISLFIFLLSKYTDTKRLRDVSKALVALNEEEIKIAAGDFHHRESGEAFINPLHYYSLDIDLFGRGSFFQFINRTGINEGTEKLAESLTANQIENIPLKQNAIKELSGKPEWRQQFSAVATLIEAETPALKIIEWLTSHKSFLPKIMSWFPKVFSVASLVMIALGMFKIIDLGFIGYWLILGLLITGLYLKKINVLAANTDKVRDTFRQYALLLNQIESESFSSELLKNKQAHIQQEQKKASEIFSQFSKYLDALDNRNNLISAIFGNGFFLSDLKNAYRIEQWISQYKTTVANWFEVVSFFDAYNTLGNYAFNHPDYVFPEIVENSTVIEAVDLGHPLLDKNKRVDSNLDIHNQEFFIVTGANMAGKSTFLRTVSLHIVMANAGLPVCAKSSKYAPVKLITSMRTSDSLTDDSSYFFSELTRLKFIVDEISKEPYFIILDEILKGTNSTDKAIGSRKFVEKLVASNATGIIATHDLSLCEISKELPDVKNHFFDAQIVNDELFFDYKFKDGICQNMNASFLLKKMAII